MNQKEMGAFIRQYRKKQQMTQAELASILYVSNKSISRWENGKTMPDISMYEPLCAALQIQLIELLEAKELSKEEINLHSDKTAFQLLATRSQLQTLSIFTEILIVIGILISITFTKLLAETSIEIIGTLLAGTFVWSFGIWLRIKLRKAIALLDES